MVTGPCSGIPSDARGYAMNVTAIQNGNPMPFLTVYPTGDAGAGECVCIPVDGCGGGGEWVFWAVGCGAGLAYSRLLGRQHATATKML